MDVLAYSCIAIGWSLAGDHELSTGRGRKPTKKCCCSFCELWCVAGTLFAFLVLRFAPVLCHSGLFGARGLWEVWDKAVERLIQSLNSAQSDTLHPTRGFTHRRERQVTL